MASSCPTSKCKEISLLLLGKPGHGTSATGNTILGRTAFTKSDTPDSITVTATLNCSEREDGTIIRVVDTPGVMETDSKNDKTFLKVCGAMSLCPNGFNALIYVVQFGIRYTKEDMESLDILKEYFGSRFLQDYSVIVMTHGDHFDLHHEGEEITFKDWLDKQNCYAQLLQECNNRCVLFYNVGRKYEDKRKDCVSELLNLIKAEIPIPYTSEHIKLAKVMREKAILKLGAPMLHTSIQEKLCLLIDQLHRDIKNNTFSYETMLENLDKLEKEVDSVKGEFKKLSDFESLKESVASVRQKLRRIFSLEEREKQNIEKVQVLKDLENLKKAAGRILIYLSRAFYIFAKTLKPIGSVVALGEKGECLQDIERISEMILNESIGNKYKGAKKLPTKSCKQM